MDEQKKKQIDRNITILSFGVLLCAIGYAVYQGITKQADAHRFDIIMVCALAIFWVLMDVVRPKLTGELDGITDDEKRKHWLLALLDLGGYAGLAYFVIAREGQTGIYGAVVFLLTTIGKRKIREGGQEDAQSEELTDEQADVRSEEQAGTQTEELTDEQAAQTEEPTDSKTTD